MFQLDIYNAGLNAVFEWFMNRIAVAPMCAKPAVKGKVLKLFIGRMINVNFIADQKMEYNILMENFVKLQLWMRLINSLKLPLLN